MGSTSRALWAAASKPALPRIAVIGGGPAGASMAKLIAESKQADVSVYEAAPRIGGKSMTFAYGGALHEMGTCYSTLAHGLTNRWMRDLGIKQTPLGTQLVDGVPLMDFVRSGPGPSLASETLTYLRLWRNHTLAVAKRPNHPQVRDECAMTIDAWLHQHKLVRIRRFMLRALTNMGYGFLDEVSMLQALRWCTPGLILSGALGQIKMPDGGWQVFWERLTKGLDIRTSEPVLGLERRNAGVAVTSPSGTEQFAHAIITVAPGDAAKFLRLSQQEKEVCDAIEWGEYVTTLFEADNWFTKHEAEAYSHTLYPGAPRGQMLSARRLPRGRVAPLTQSVYLSGQYGTSESSAALQARLAHDVNARGAAYRRSILQKRWTYFPLYRREAVQDGLVSRMQAIQGQGNIWWSGAAFSHEAVSNIVSFNKSLWRQIQPALKAAEPQSLRKLEMSVSR